LFCISWSDAMLEGLFNTSMDRYIANKYIFSYEFYLV
jgi:hypothetical protein